MENIETLQAEFNTAIQQITQKLSASVNSEDLQQASKELDETKAQLTVLDEQLEQQKENYLSLSENYGSLELEMSKVTAQNAELANQPASDPAEVEGLKATITSINSALAERNADIQKLQNEVEAEKQRTAARQIVADSTKQQNDDLRAQLIGLQNQTPAAPEQPIDERLAKSLQQREEDIEDVDKILKLLKPLIEG